MKYYIIAGEASGDLHGSNLIKSLKKKDEKAEFRFFGGDLMQKEGRNLVKHYREMAFMGFVNVILNSRTILHNLRFCKDDIISYAPDVVILIDYAGFNLKIAKFVKTKMTIPVFYYIPPKIWAWKEHRIKAIKRYVDNVYTIFPFESNFYAKHNYKVNYVGNPSVQSVNQRICKGELRSDFLQQNNLSDKKIVVLLAGSRKQEIVSTLPIFMNIDFSLFQAEYQFVVAGTASMSPEIYTDIVGDRNVSIVYGKTYELLQQADFALVNSGTATLETALFHVPQVVCYQMFMGRLFYPFVKHVLKTRFVSLVNIIAQKEVVKELLAYNFTAKNVQKELSRLIYNAEYRNNILNEYTEIEKNLGNTVASDTAADLMIKNLQSDK